MTAQLYLIAHSVRGEAAFDVAIQMECPHCQGHSNEGREPYVCFDCDDKGWWWIIPTSGHRAFPYWYIGLDEVPDLTCLFESAAPIDPRYHVPSGWPDHYRHGPAPTIDIMSLFKAHRKGEPKPHIQRRL